MAKFKIKRVYEDAEPGDGFRVLVDRLWPRGVKKDKVDLWLKEIGPSNELRNWFHHEPRKFGDFARKYRVELKANPAVAELRKLGREHKIITLLYGARDTENNQAVVLRKHLSAK
jgi:DNA-3-methyladenine glycosylase